MRDKLNSNPIAQVALVAVLGILVAFLLLTRMGGSAEPPPEETATTSAVPATSDPAATDATAVAPVTGTEPAVPTAPTDPAAVAADAGRFVAGPGLPERVVKAYAQGEVVALLVTKHNGDADRKLREASSQLGSRDEVTLIGTSARNLSDFSRIAQGVDLSRVPALIVLRPRNLSKGELPEASVSYGYRGPDSVVQAMRDAAYKGRSNIPSYPE